MPYPLDSNDLAAIARLASFYNGGNFDAGSNPGGMAAGGHRTNFIPSLQDEARIGSASAAAADSASTSATSASGSAASAAATITALTGTSTTSVIIGTGSQGFVTQAGKSFNVGTFVDIVSDASPTTHYMIGQVTAYAGTSLTVSVSVASGSGARSDWTIYGRAGTPGAQGFTGNTGAQGETPFLKWTFSTSITDSDPGNGTFRFNNATLSAVTAAFFDNLDNNSSDQTAFLDQLDDSTTASNKGLLFFQQVGAAGTYAILRIAGSPNAVVDGGGYRKIPLVYVGSNGSFANGALFAVAFARTGDAGLDGAGAGDTISDISSAVSGDLVQYNGTTGKHVTTSAIGIGTTGHKVPALDGVNTWSGVQSFGARVDMQQDVRLSGDITPAQITTNQNDYAPAGNATASVFRLSTDASRDVTGITNGADGRTIVIINVGANDIVLKNDVTSTASNRFLFGGDVTLAPGQSLEVIYDATQLRWLARSGDVGLGASGSATRPTWSFSTDPDSGLYRVSANDIALAVNGTKVLELSNPTGSVYQIGAPDGAVGTPGLAFTGDTDTGFYRIGANNVGLALGGVKSIDAGASAVDIPFLTQAGPTSGLLSFSSATALQFKPLKGDRIKINGKLYAIPSGGIAGLGNTGVFVNGVGGQNLVANTVYLVTAFDSGGTVTADFYAVPSFTHQPDTAANNVGVEVPAAVSPATVISSRSVIGLVRTNASAQFVDSATQRFVRSWFNRQSESLVIFNRFSAQRSTASATFVEVNTEIRVEFLVWSSDETVVSFNGAHYSDTANSQGSSAIGWDGAVTIPFSFCEVTGGGGDVNQTTAAISEARALSEGYHFVTWMAAMSGGGTYNLGLSVTNFWNSISGRIHT